MYIETTKQYKVKTGQPLSEFLSDNGISQYECARLFNKHQSNIRNWLRQNATLRTDDGKVVIQVIRDVHSIDLAKQEGLVKP